MTSVQKPWPQIFTMPAAIQAQDGVKPMGLIIVGGDYGVGKTISGLELLPRPPHYPAAPTLTFDTEKSALSHASNYRVDIVDLADIDPLRMYITAKDRIAKISEGEYAVIMFDTPTPLEEGARQWLKANATFFGQDRRTYDKMAGIFHADVKRLIAEQLIVPAMHKAQVVVATAHLRAQWQGNSPLPGKYEMKGLEVWEMYASLKAWLIPGEKGRGIGAPSAVNLKSRLMYKDWQQWDEEADLMGENVPTLPLFPMFFREFSAKALRDYINNPRQKFSDVEMRVVDPSQLALNDDTRLLLQREIAQAQLEAVSAQKEETTHEAKARMCRELMDEGYCSSLADIGALVNKLGLTAHANQPGQINAVKEAIIAHINAERQEAATPA